VATVVVVLDVVDQQPAAGFNELDGAPKYLLEVRELLSVRGIPNVK